MSYNRRSADNVLSACSVIMALGLMAPAFWAGPLVLDEHAAYWLSAPDGSLSIWERSTRYAAAPPLANWAQAVSMRLLGETELALRLPSTLAYVAAVVVMGFGFRSSMGARAAALAACALALHPDVVDEVRVGRTYGFVVLVTTLLLLITFRWRSPRIVLREGLFWGLTAAAAVWTHVLTIPVVAISAVLLGICDVLQFRSLRPATVLGWVLAGLLCVPLVPMGERIWEWRYALNFQTGSVALREALGPVVWLALPLAAAAAVITTCFQQIR
ncbi:MAG: glycosyltransferase family 39 protein, partial [Planctomycetaceae bacterium]